ncbi:MAG: exosortase/archaeosortase family protein [Elusimicrobia bacterium]|nr:exosortase/archaeosortase family protein [Elusimicrobiota bacterium]
MHYLLITGIFSLLYWFVFSDIFNWLVKSWIHNTFYTHSFIIVFFCLILIVINGCRIKKIVLKFKSVILFWVAACIFIFLGLYYRFPYLIATAYPICCLAINKTFLAQEYTYYLNLPFLLIILVFPLPFLYEISGYFSFVSAKTAVSLLKLFYPSVIVNGIEIYIPPDVVFSIGINCSGANSILALVTIIILWAIIIKNKPMITYSMLLLALPVGFFTNVLRIVCIFIIAKAGGMDLAIRFWHNFAGYFFYIVSLTLMFMVWHIFHRIYKDRTEIRRLIIP